MIYGEGLVKGEEKGEVGYMIGEENRGIEWMLKMMKNERIIVGIKGVGVEEEEYKKDIEYEKERKKGREIGEDKKKGMRKIIEKKDVKRMLMKMKEMKKVER